MRPELVPITDDPLAGCDGATSIILFQMDVIHGLTLSEIHPDAVTTAYGPLAAGAFCGDRAGVILSGSGAQLRVRLKVLPECFGCPVMALRVPVGIIFERSFGQVVAD